MNVAPSYPNFVPLALQPTTEAAKRDNVRRERIPEPEESKAGQTDNRQDNSTSPSPAYINPPTKKQSADTYSLASIKSNASQSQSDSSSTSSDAVTAAADQSKDKQQTSSGDNSSSDSGQDKEKNQKEQQAVQDLKKRDAEVRTHEQAHQSVGGQYASAPSYDMTQGPDGKSYATGGHVNIDVSPVPNNPQATINKMTQVENAALAPADPSSQDRKVAAQAASMAMKARSELSKPKSGSGSTNQDSASGNNTASSMQQRNDTISNRYLSSGRPQPQTAMSIYA